MWPRKGPFIFVGAILCLQPEPVNEMNTKFARIWHLFNKNYRP